MLAQGLGVSKKGVEFRQEANGSEQGRDILAIDHRRVQIGVGEVLVADPKLAQYRQVVADLVPLRDEKVVLVARSEPHRDRRPPRPVFCDEVRHHVHNDREVQDP